MFQFLLCQFLFTISSSRGIFIGNEQDVGSPLRVAQCRSTCLERFSNSVNNGESTCLQGPDCFMCWENCELLQSNYQVWGAMCEEKEICFPGCQEACHFHAEAASRIQQTQPVIHTKGEGVISVTGSQATWPRPSSADPNTPLVYVVMRKMLSGPWRQVIQTLNLSTRVPVSSNQDSMLRVLVVDPQGLVTIYSPDEASSKDTKKTKKTVNTEINAKKRNDLQPSKITKTDSWVLQEISLIHQKVLVIGEIAWAPKASKGVYLVTWEVDGGGLKGNLFTDSTCVTLSLWPDTIYHIQVELVSSKPGVENLKSEMMDLDTGRAQKVSTESQEDLVMMNDESPENIDFNSPLLPITNSIRRDHYKRWISTEVVLGGVAAILLFAMVLFYLLWKTRERSGGMFLHNILTGSSGFQSQKLVEDLSDCTTDIHPVITVTDSAFCNLSNSSLSSTHPFSSNSNASVSCDRSTRHEVQV